MMGRVEGKIDALEENLARREQERKLLESFMNNLMDNETETPQSHSNILDQVKKFRHFNVF